MSYPVNEGQPCPRCCGSGAMRTRAASYFDEGDWVDCPSCKGSGEIDMLDEGRVLREVWEIPKCPCGVPLISETEHADQLCCNCWAEKHDATPDEAMSHATQALRRAS